MNIIRSAALSLVGITLMAAPAFAASDISNSASLSNRATSLIAATSASTMTSSIIGSAISNAITGSVGGFTPTFTPTAPSASPTVPVPGAGPIPPTNGGAGPIGPVSMNTRQMGKAGAANPSNLGLWAQGSFMSIDKSEEALQMDGNVYAMASGIDYKFNDRGVVGLSLGYEKTDIDTTYNNGTFEGSGIAVAPYFGYVLTPNWSIDATIGHVWLDYDVTRNSDTARGSYEGSRWFGSSSLNGSYAVDRWRLSPKVGVLYLKENADDYTETGTAGNGFVEGAVTTLGRASAGLKAGYAFDTFMPYGRVTGEWDFNKPNAALKSNGQLSQVDAGGLALALGVDFFSGPISGSVELGYDSAMREDLDVWKGSARIRYDF